MIRTEAPLAAIAVHVDAANPGQFFACCGLLEFAGRLHAGAVGWFSDREFHIAGGGSLEELIETIVASRLIQTAANNDTSSRIWVIPPAGERLDAWDDVRDTIVQEDNDETQFHRDLDDGFLLDWWHDDRAGGRELKVWAGTMESVRIALAMQHAMRAPAFRSPDLFDVGLIAYDPADLKKKVEPFYFDARRGPNSHSRDVGFSPNDLSMTTTAFPAVELLCLIGLQRVLPKRTNRPRIYEYDAWRSPAPPELAPAFASGRVPGVTLGRYRFENWYRTGQKKHKAFLPAVPVSIRDDQ